MKLAIGLSGLLCIRLMRLIHSLHTPLDVPIALFLISALIGVWASYDPATSWNKFAMIVAAVALYYILVGLRATPQLLETFVWLFLFGCCALTLYFVTQHDYSTHPGKFDFITVIGLSLNHITPRLGLHFFDPNITAGALEIGMPAALALAACQKEKVTLAPGRKCREERQEAVASRQSTAARKGWTSVGFLAALFMSTFIAFGLVMTSSRGAWLALATVGAAGLMLVTARDALRRYALPLVIICGLIAFIFAFELRDTMPSFLDDLVGKIPAGDAMVSRASLLGQAWGLVQDYYFTGSGLGVFPMVLSTYALLIDVPFLTHAHNLFMQVWVEQGLLGFVAFSWLVFEFYLWAWKTGSSRQKPLGSQPSTAPLRSRGVRGIDSRQIGLTWLMWGGIAAATVMLLHGIVDVLLYSSRGLPLMMVPFGMAVASGQNTQYRIQNTEYRTKSPEGEKKTISLEPVSGNLKPATWNRKLGAVLLVVFGLFLSSFILHPSSFLALWYVNLGSVEQTRVELAQYRWPDRLVEKVRKDCGVRTADCALAAAEGYFHQALVLDPGNVTANQRLGTIALTQGSFDYAESALRNAYERDPANSVTRRLMAKMQ